METALGWFGEIMRWVGNLLPRWAIVRATEKLVKFKRGHLVQVSDPGIRWYWPAFTDVEQITVVRQTLNLSPQTLMTADGDTVIASGVIVFTIENVVKYLVDNYDADEAIAEVASAALRKVIISKTIEDIQRGRADIDNALSRETQKLMEDFGILIVYMRLVNFSKAKVFNFVTTGGPPVDLAGGHVSLN